MLHYKIRPEVIEFKSARLFRAAARPQCSARGDCRRKLALSGYFSVGGGFSICHNRSLKLQKVDGYPGTGRETARGVALLNCTYKVMNAVNLSTH